MEKLKRNILCLTCLSLCHRYTEILYSRTELQICSKSASNLTGSRLHITCQYHNLLKMLDFKWIS